MKLALNSLRVTSVFLILVALLAWNASPALAVSSAQGQCEAHGGRWSGADANNGTCTHDEGTDYAEEYCGSSYADYIESFTAGALTGSHCHYTRGFGGRGDTTDNKAASGPVTLTLSGGKNGKVTFPGGLCDPQCSITPSLPKAAKSALPSGVLSTLYVRVPNASASYLVCFKNPSGATLSAYQLVGDTWYLRLVSSSNPACFYSTGSGIFYLTD